jgi:sugar transferase (PEP-CTERM/EpsH1 system associated)
MEVGVTKLVNGANLDRVRADVCSFTPVGRFRERLAPHVRLFELERHSAFDWRLVNELRRLLQHEQFDVVHTHAWGTLCEGWIAARLAGVPHVVHGEHGTMETRPRNLKVQRFVWGRVDRVLSVSERLADRMAREVGYPRERIQTIRNGLDLDQWAAGDRHKTRAALGAAPNEVLVLAVGRLVSVKNHALLLTAFAQARTDGTHCRLLIAGDGPLRPELESQIRSLGIDAEVSLLGERRDVPDLLAACDVFVLSSDSEGMSNTIIEAMAAGRPVIATHVGGNPELVASGTTGVLVESGNVAAMAAAIASLASDCAGRERMGAAGRERARREFAVNRMLDDYERMYLDVAAGR